MFIRFLLSAFAILLSVVNASSDVLIDFGMNGSTPSGAFPDQRTTSTNPVWNNLAIGSSSGGAANAPGTILIAKNGGLPTLSSATLSDITGADSGISISFTATGTKAASIGTAGTGGLYNGTLPPVAASAFPSSSATIDGIYVNGITGGIGLTVTLTGLSNGQAYDLTAFSGRNGTTAEGQWTLVTGNAATTRFQSANGTFNANNGQTLTNGGTNAGIALQWLKVTPVAGTIAFKITANSSSPADLNALRISPSVPEEIDVYFLGGQSNMQGLGKLNELTPQQLTPPANISFWNGSSFVPLVPGSTPTASTGEFGPEIAFATEIAKSGRKAYIVKYSNSGKPLDAGWNDQVWNGDPPAPNRVNFYPGTSPTDPNQGILYKNEMLPRFQAALAAITASGDIPVIRGFLWMQGEQDSKNAISASRYAANLSRLRDRLATDLGIADPTTLPLVFGQVLPKDPPAARFTFRNEIRADMALADQDSGSPKAIPLCRMVSTDSYAVYDDEVHYTTPSQLKLGKAFATALAELTAKPLHICFHYSSSGTQAAMDSTAAPLTQGSRVNTASQFWNHLSSASAYTFSSIPISNADGAATTATLSGTTGFVSSNANGWASANKDAVMMDGWYGLRGTESISVTNLPPDVAQRFHVIIYGDSTNTDRTMNYTINGITRTIQETGNFSGTFSKGANYVVISGLSGSSFTLNGNAAGSPRSAVNAISIVPGDALTIDSFLASDHYIQPGQQSTLSWEVIKSSNVTISPSIGTVSSSGSIVVSPSTTTTYTITAQNNDEIETRTVRVAVGPERPNIVFFLVDDMGWQDTSVPFYHDANGNPVVTGFNQRYRTPHMQALANSGVKFTNAYSCSICSPSRVSLMTGQSPARHRVTQWTLDQNTDQSGVSTDLKSPLNWNVNGLMLDSAPLAPRTWRTAHTLPGELSKAGYQTIHAGKAHLTARGLSGENPRDLGFDVNIAGHAAGGPSSFLGTANYAGPDARFNVPGLEAYHGTDTYLTEAITLEANKSVEKAVSEGKPFFLHMAHYAIHVPLMEDTRFSANYPGVDATERKYATMIEGMDKSLGDIRAKLEQLGVAENTLIIFYSDNGGYTGSVRGVTPAGTSTYTHNKPLRSGKGSAYEGGTRVPAIAAWAKADSSSSFQQMWPIAPGTRNDKPLIIEDWMPSILHLAGVTPPAVDGQNITPYLVGDSAFTRPEPLLFHFPHIVAPESINANQGYEMHSSLREGDWKVIHYYQGSRWELYHLANDLGEANNLAASRPDLVFQLGRKMIRLLNERNAVYPVNRNTNLPHPPLLPNNTTVDSDNDGLTDLQEDPNRNGIIDPGESNPDKADSDQDGTPDAAEISMGLDPLNPTSSFQVLNSQPELGTLRLTWPSLPGNTFTIQRSENLIDWPEVVTSNLPAATGSARWTSFDTPTQGNASFYKIILE